MFKSTFVLTPWPSWMLGWGFKIANLHRIEVRSFSWNEGWVVLFRLHPMCRLSLNGSTESLHELTAELSMYSACKLYPRLGFVLEGRLREQFWYNGRWGDEMCYGMLKSEWEDRVVQANARQEG